MIKKLRKISTAEKYSNPWWKYNIDRYEMPDGHEGDYHYVHSSGSTFIIPITDEGNFFLVKQFRYLNQKESLEFPGGGIKRGLTPAENAVEELREEAGLLSEKIIYLGSFNPFNGVTDEICNVYLAESVKSVGNSPEPSEEFDIVELTFSELINKIAKGEIWDGMTLTAWSLYIYSEHLQK